LSKPKWQPSTIAAQAGGLVDPVTGAIVPPIQMASTFERDPDNAYRRGYIYARPDNPNVRQAEHVLQALEEAAACLLMGSGMAAAHPLAGTWRLEPELGTNLAAWRALDLIIEVDGDQVTLSRYSKRRPIRCGASATSRLRRRRHIRLAHFSGSTRPWRRRC